MGRCPLPPNLETDKLAISVTKSVAAACDSHAKVTTTHDREDSPLSAGRTSRHDHGEVSASVRPQTHSGAFRTTATAFAPLAGRKGPGRVRGRPPRPVSSARPASRPGSTAGGG